MNYKRGLKLKRVVSIFLCMILLISNVMPVYAEGEGTADSGFKGENGNTYYYENGARVTGERYIVDESGIGYWYYFIPGPVA